MMSQTLRVSLRYDPSLLGNLEVLETNFSMESIEQTFNGSADFGKKVTCTVSRNGDLIHRVYLRVQLPSVTVPAKTAFRWLNWVGHILVKNVEIEIGGQRIDRQFGDWLHIWNELTQSAGHQLGYANMVGNIPQLTTPLKNTHATNSTTLSGEILYIPLEFWSTMGQSEGKQSPSLVAAF